MFNATETALREHWLQYVLSVFIAFISIQCYDLSVAISIVTVSVSYARIAISYCIVAPQTICVPTPMTRLQSMNRFVSSKHVSP